MSGIRVNEWLHNSGTGGIWQSSAGNVGIASSVPTAKLVVTGDTNVSGAATVTGNLNVSGVSTAAAFIPSAGHLSHRNLIINGDMQVAQYGTSSTSAGYKTVDRLTASFSGQDEAPTFAQHALTSSDTGPWELGFRSSYHVTNGNQTGGAGASDYLQIDYKLEAQDIANSGWNYNSTSDYITLSFWIRSSVAQVFNFTVGTTDGTAKRYLMKTPSLSANTWTKVIKTIPGDSAIQFDNNTALGWTIHFWPFLGTTWSTSGVAQESWIVNNNAQYSDDMTSTWWTTNDATWEITGLQLEVGAVATPFEHRGYAEELRRCQRYYNTNPNVYFSSVASVQMFFPQTMRAAPTVTHDHSGGSTSNINAHGFMGFNSGNTVADYYATAEL